MFTLLLLKYFKQKKFWKEKGTRTAGWTENALAEN